GRASGLPGREKIAECRLKISDSTATADPSLATRARDDKQDCGGQGRFVRDDKQIGSVREGSFVMTITRPCFFQDFRRVSLSSRRNQRSETKVDRHDGI